jgi:transcriptional regulator GlxA family with amidase domain
VESNLLANGDDAGISAGIDMALAILEDLKGPLFTHKVARDLAEYLRKRQAPLSWNT